MSFLLNILLAANILFTPPVDYEMTLAGNFGEPRPHHFHGGIDIKTGGVEGKHIYAIGDGYVSRVTVGLYGFGNAVYVTHPEGYTSVYCHLKRFSPRIQTMLGRVYNPNTDEADFHFNPLQLPVSQGQLIAISGNTGHSMAPHLHLEIHDTRSWNTLDPLDFLGYAINDSVPPMAHGLMAVPQSGRGVFCGTTEKQTFPISSNHLETAFTAWGEVGFALWANDYSQQTYNHYGVRETILMVDGNEVFHAIVDRVPTFSTRQVNGWGDYVHWRRSGVWYLRSYLPQGLHLPMLHADDHRGIVCFSEERPYHLVYVLRDFRGNESRYEFSVQGRKCTLTKPSSAPHNGLTTMCSRPGVQLTLPSGCLVDDVPLHPMVSVGKYSVRCTFASTNVPLLTPAELCLAVTTDVDDPERLYVSDGAGNHLGGTYHNGWVTTYVNDLNATYELAYETKQNE